ncbi:hypothetical protein PPL_06699 [Heterostelium album PN500]|uniref:Chitinase n=1 Tax=Heterostelium pallidum (strain ATCC 26659 / Pp 5 / PN500) TaxID=670386 RepID=D3BFG5_HETP5|nr:hypothetical protein PPL_06699 [Heterostelium album PN500]EFA79879.1 hypothetical protein PPL_06699 [Heterostelium album PN500]|eukprot:XP_020432000.1 hypothetical protein PPL_06699 [Heterostelium album PN500]
MKLFITLLLCILSFASVSNSTTADLTKIYGIWHCGLDYCLWHQEVPISEFDWIVDRGDGKPSFNLLVFAFLNPVKVLQEGLDAVPKAINHSTVQYLQSKGISVQFSIGGATWVGAWNTALSTDPVTLAKNAALIALNYSVGIEIDYEGAKSVPLIDTFVSTYRQLIPANSTNSDSALLTVDTGAGTGYLTEVSEYASKWLAAGQIDWINAMVGSGPYTSIDQAIPYWEQHLHGQGKKVAPIQPSQLVVNLYSCDGSPICNTYQNTVLQGAIDWVTSNSTRGINFWAAGCQGPNQCCDNCSGIEQGSQAFLGN